MNNASKIVFIYFILINSIQVIYAQNLVCAGINKGLKENIKLFRELKLHNKNNEVGIKQ